MNIIEYGCYDLADNEKETKEKIEQASGFSPSVISVFPFYLRSAKNVLSNNDIKDIKLSCVIDYPFGISDSESRIVSVDQAIKHGADCIELVMSNHLLCNRKYEKIRKELFTISQMCLKNNIDLRVVLEYKIFTPELLYKASYILLEFNIFTIYPSANFLMDSVADNILASMLISKKNPKINIIINGSAWTDNHIEMILSNKNIYGYKTSNIYTLEKICQKNL